MLASLRSDRAASLLRIAVIVACVFMIFLFCYTAAGRLHSPAELEQHEGYMTMSVYHLFHGGSLYHRPDFTFLANMYPPLFYYAAAGVAKVTGGVTLSTARIVSILSTLGAFLLIGLLVKNEDRRGWIPALIGAALYASMYRACGAWFDVGRLDSFYVFMVLLAIYCTRKLPAPLAALVWVAAVQTKQPILPVAVLMLAYDFRNVKRTVSGLGVFFVALAASVFALNHASGGWYSLFIFKEPSANANMILRPGAMFWPQNIFEPLGIACAVIFAAAVFTRPDLRSKATRFYLVSFSIVLLTWYQMMHNGSSANILMPAYALIAVLFGISVARLQEWLKTRGEAPVLEGLLLTAVFIQIAAGTYNPGAYFPTTENLRAAKTLVSNLRSTPGDVYIADHPYFAVEAGKPEHPDLISLKETTQAMHPADATALRAKIANDLCSGEIHALYFDDLRDVDYFGSLVHLRPEWKTHFSEPALVEGGTPKTRPAWVMTAQGNAGGSCAE